MTATRPSAVLIVALSLVAAACGASEETTSQPPAAAETTTTEATTTTITAEPTTTTVAEPTTTTVAEPTTTTLAGVPTDLGPEAGAVLSVVGVAHDDVLNVREAPGIFNERVAAIEPTGTAVATGTARDLGQAIWILLDADGERGWSNLFFLAYEGATDDATSEVRALLAADSAPSMEELGLLVAETQASTEPASMIVMSVAATGDDDGEVTYDVIGLGDDAVRGYRLHVFGRYEPDAYALTGVARTALCSRGVDTDGLCV